MGESHFLTKVISLFFKCFIAENVGTWRLARYVNHEKVKDDLNNPPKQGKSLFRTFIFNATNYSKTEEAEAKTVSIRNIPYQGFL